MKIRARRGVCIGVDRHLQAGDLADLDAAQVQFLVSIGAVERVSDEPVQEPTSTGSNSQEPATASAEAGKKKK